MKQGVHGRLGLERQRLARGGKYSNKHAVFQGRGEVSSTGLTPVHNWGPPPISPRRGKLVHRHRGPIDEYQLAQMIIPWNIQHVSHGPVILCTLFRNECIPLENSPHLESGI